ncbi:MAG: GlsB/YeaQ/YmgE family stress response membrane protein [Alphaproteobacteria bacterium]
MNGIGLLSAIIVGIFAGWIAEQIMHRKDGLLTNLIIGLLGALMGSFLAGMFGVGFAGFWGSLAVSTIGAVVLLVLVNMVRGKPAV